MILVSITLVWMISAMRCLVCFSSNILLTSFCLPVRKNSVLMNGYLLLKAAKYIWSCCAVADAYTTRAPSFLAPATSCAWVWADAVAPMQLTTAIKIPTSIESMNSPSERKLIDNHSLCQWRNQPDHHIAPVHGAVRVASVKRSYP